ncbi:MAG TPA: hypothetical protein PLK54_04890, partial [Ferruginibacter sp.]|nr:hypothetical protein [Ferruginibacter sp.]
SGNEVKNRCALVINYFLFHNNLFTFCLDTKSNKKIKAGRITASSCRTAMLSICTSVTSAFDLGWFHFKWSVKAASLK